ncbi:DUF1697 domain-containing protein [Agromyces sp. H66]|uniref:DUF1697 domain-containing protein n=1 Tax=Agromyces sp. H66 TaxID=2529859 RepID=UPI0010A9E3A9|nr:DUF1697 domain-containing protein [Agromyces sp. H66]
MTAYVALLRGINVGGKNPIGMQDLAECFRAAGYEEVRTHLQSGNVLFSSSRRSGSDVEETIERMLRQRFDIPIPAIVRSRDELDATVASAPADHGSAELRSDVFFLKHPLTADVVMAQMPDLRAGVDAIVPGPGALYFSRVAAQAGKTRITRLMAMPVFQQMTVRTWRTTTRLLGVLHES